MPRLLYEARAKQMAGTATQGLLSAQSTSICTAACAAGCAHQNVTVEAGKTYLVRLISATSLLYTVRTAAAPALAQPCATDTSHLCSSAHKWPQIGLK